MAEQIELFQPMSNLRVWYGFTRLTKKMVRKRELAIWFENEWAGNNEEWVAKRCNIAAVRNQTKKEADDGTSANRRFTKYSYLIDDKKTFKGDIDAVLQQNFEADKNNVDAELLNEIGELLLKKYKELRY